MIDMPTALPAYQQLGRSLPSETIIACSARSGRGISEVGLALAALCGQVTSPAGVR